MRNTLEDIVTEDDRARLLKVQKAIDWSFRNLVKLSGLRPEKDFQELDLRELDLRGADLRGFNFTGSDLRGCIKDSDTLVDESTDFSNCKLDWLENSNPKITDLMANIQGTNSREEKKKLLDELVSNYMSPDHIRLFIRGQIERTDSIDSLVVLADHFDASTDADRRALFQTLQRISLNSARKRARRGSRTLSPMGFSRFLATLSQSKNPQVSAILGTYYEKSSHDGRVSLDPNVFEVSEDLKRFLGAVDETSEQQAKTLL